MSPRFLPLLLLLGGLSSACSLSRTATRVVEAQTRSQGLQDHTVLLGGRSVRYWMGGQGPPLLLLHGFGGNGLWTWKRQVRALSRTHTLIIPDLLWFGASHSLGPLEPGLAVQVDTMAALLDHLGQARVDVMGISYGGFVTLLLAQRHPERVASVIIVDSPGPVFDAADRQAMLARLEVEDPQQMFVPQDAGDVAALVAIVRPHGPAIPRFLLEDIRRHQFSQNHDQHRALLSDLVGLDGVFVPQSWVRPARSLVIWGDQDPVFPLSEGTQLAEALGARLVVIEDAAHGPNFQHPRPFNQAVLEFLDGETPEPPGVAP